MPRRSRGAIWVRRLIKFKMLNRLSQEFREIAYPKPPECCFCGKKLSLYEDLWCEKCLTEICCRKKNAQVCAICGKSAQHHAGYHVCQGCQDRRPSFIFNRSVGGYHGLVREVLHKFKYRGLRSLALPVGRLMALEAVKWPEYLSCDFVSFIPLASEKLNERGYNQAELLAYEVGRWLRLPIKDVLEKVCETPDMAKLSREERLSNLFNVFRCKESFAEKRVILVDDVLTTGSTATICCEQLLAAGAENVYVLTFASGRD